MKLIGTALIGLFLALNAQAQTGVAFGSLALGGTACRLGGVGPIKVQIEDGILQIPAASLVRKDATDSLERGTCQFTLPARLAPGYRLVLKDLVAIGDLNLARGTNSRVDLEVFAAGEHGQRISNTDGSSQYKVRKTLHMKEPGTVFVSDCGAAFNLRGNSSILLQGAAASKSTAALHLIEMSAQIEKCQ